MAFVRDRQQPQQPQQPEAPRQQQGGFVRDAPVANGGPGGGTYTGQPPTPGSIMSMWDPEAASMPLDKWQARNRDQFLSLFKSDPTATKMPIEDWRAQNRHDAGNFTRGMADVTSWGTSDEIMAGLRGLNPWSNTTYSQRLAEERKALADSGKAGTAGQLLGGFLMPGSGVKKAALSGGAYGFGSGEGDLINRLEHGLIGSLLGAGTSKAMGWMSNWFKGKPPPARAADDVYDAGHQLYTAAEQQGVNFHPVAVADLADGLRNAAGGINKGLRPKTAGFVKDINKDMKGPMPLRTFDEWRQRLGKEIGMPGTSADDARTLTAMKSAVTDFENNVQPHQMTGNGPAALDFLTRARSNWHMASKLDDLERISEKAAIPGTEAGRTAVLKAETTRIVKRIIDNKDGRWSDDERALLENVAKGGDVSLLTHFIKQLRPTGPLRILAGQALGSIIPGGHYIAPIAGATAAHTANNAAPAAMATLQRTVSGYGGRPIPLAPQGKWLRAHSVGLPTAAVSQTPLDMLLKPTTEKPQGGLIGTLMQ